MPRQNRLIHVGDRAPDFELPEAFGGKRSLRELVREQPLVLAFHRGTWCRSCRTFLRNLEQQTENAKDARFAVIVCQSLEAVSSYFDPDRPPFDVLADETRSVAKEWGVFHLLGFDAVNIARPATFVIDASQVVQYVFVASYQSEQPDFREVRAVLGRLAEPTPRVPE